MRIDREMKDRLLSHWGADKSQELIDLNYGDLLRKVASEVPERTALVEAVPKIEQRRRWSYRELLEQSEKIAYALLEQFEAGDHIAVYASNSAEWVLLQHGLSLAGMVLVPVNPAYSEAELSVILKNADVKGVFYEKTYRGCNLAEIVRCIAQKIEVIKRIFSLGVIQEWLSSEHSVQSLPTPQNTDVIMLQFTSGTTGVPKGACLHHLGVINASRFVAERAGFKEGDVWVNAMPMFHIAGSCVTRIGALALRGTYVVLPYYDEELMLNVIENEKGNVALLVPTMVLGMLDHPNLKNYNVSSLATILCGAADVPPSMVLRAKDEFGCEISILFGQTEANGTFCQARLDDSIKDKTETLGQPLPHAEVAIMNPEGNEIVPRGQSGEICVRGYLTMAGYYGMEKETKKALGEDGWLHTGDMGVMDERGYLKISGRIKDMIIRGGMNIYPREIEDILFSHPAVGQVSVIGLPDPKWGEIVAAVIIPADTTQEVDPGKLFSYCRENLASHKSPVKWFFVNEYPLTPSGKVQKYKLQESVREGEIEATNWQRSNV